MRKRGKNKKQNIWQLVISVVIAICIILSGYINKSIESATTHIENADSKEKVIFDLTTVPEYSTVPYIEINNNIPYFSEEDYTTEPFEKYSDLDEYGRCGVAFVNVCKEIMPPSGDERGNISSIIPTGWKQKKYDGEYFYNRCHLIAHQLSDEDANKYNLVTGTRYLNVDGMLQFENKVAEYINKNISNHVLYRVTPIFEADNLLASGVQMEACSVEDKGQGIQFNVYCYNVQPGIVIDYLTGESYKK